MEGMLKSKVVIINLHSLIYNCIPCLVLQCSFKSIDTFMYFDIILDLGFYLIINSEPLKWMAASNRCRMMVSELQTTRRGKDKR